MDFRASAPALPAWDYPIQSSYVPERRKAQYVKRDIPSDYPSPITFTLTPNPAENLRNSLFWQAGRSQNR
jgi:hypothetical protein